MPRTSQLVRSRVGLAPRSFDYQFRAPFVPLIASFISEKVFMVSVYSTQLNVSFTRWLLLPSVIFHLA